MIFREHFSQNLREQFQELTDSDVAVWKIAVLVGIIEPPSIENPYDSFQANKGVFWSDNELGNKLGEILEILVKLDFLEEHDQQYKWNDRINNINDRIYENKICKINIHGGNFFSTGLSLAGELDKVENEFTAGQFYLTIVHEGVKLNLLIHSINWISKLENGKYRVGFECSISSEEFKNINKQELDPQIGYIGW